MYSNTAIGCRLAGPGRQEPQDGGRAAIDRLVMNPCNGMVSPPVPKTPGNHGRYRHIHLGTYVLVHHVSSPIRLMRIAHSHDVAIVRSTDFQLANSPQTVEFSIVLQYHVCQYLRHVDALLRKLLIASLTPHDR